MTESLEAAFHMPNGVEMRGHVGMMGSSVATDEAEYILESTMRGPEPQPT